MGVGEGLGTIKVKQKKTKAREGHFGATPRHRGSRFMQNQDIKLTSRSNSAISNSRKTHIYKQK